MTQNFYILRARQTVTLILSSIQSGHIIIFYVGSSVLHDIFKVSHDQIQSYFKAYY